MALDMTQHPCFNSDRRHSTGRIHLPVAPHCNIQCNYCDRKYDCLNESRPGVTSTVLEPKQALAYLNKVLERVPAIKVVGIAGPGDPFATPEPTLETLQLVREKYPEMLLCVASNGLNLTPYTARLAELQVSHVTVTINTLRPETGAKIYAWVRDHKTIYRGAAGAQLLLERQLQAVQTLKEHGITVKINTIVVPGVNDGELEEVAHEMQAHGVDLMNCIPLFPVANTPFAEIEALTPEAVKQVRGKVSAILPQMEHCTRCRADAVGLLGEDQSSKLVTLMRDAANGLFDNRQGRPYVAVTSMEGALINQHLGEAEKLWVFDWVDGAPKLIATRPAPEPGTGTLRWRQLAETISDCHTILVNGAGRKPRWVLEDSGLRVIEASGLIAQALEALNRSGEVPPSMTKQARGCSLGSGCQGSGLGCA